MPIDPAILLKRLAPPVRPTSSRPAPVGRNPLDFEALLQLVSSGEPVGEAVKGEAEGLDDGQRRRLTAAADMALARGLDTVIVMVDGRSFLLDVTARAVTREIKAASLAELVEVQAVVHAADPNALKPRPLGPPGGVAPASVQRSFNRSIGA